MEQQNVPSKLAQMKGFINIYNGRFQPCLSTPLDPKQQLSASILPKHAPLCGKVCTGVFSAAPFSVAVTGVTLDSWP